MTSAILLLIGFIIAFTSLLCALEVLYRKFRFPAEISRKIAHTLCTLSSLAFLQSFDSALYVILMGAFFTILLLIARKHKLLQSIESVGRQSAGSILLPIAIGLSFIFSKILNHTAYFILPMLILGISDPLAGIAGLIAGKKGGGIKIFSFDTHKTWIGSILFLISTLIICYVYFNFIHPVDGIVWKVICLAVSTTVVELLSGRGTDNLSVPMWVILFTSWIL